MTVSRVKCTRKPHASTTVSGPEIVNFMPRFQRLQSVRDKDQVLGFQRTLESAISQAKSEMTADTRGH